MRQVRKVLVFLCAMMAIITALALVATIGTPAAQVAWAAQTVTLRFFTWSDPKNLPITEAQVKAFEDSHPNIKIDWTNLSSGYNAKILAMIAAGIACDHC